METVSKGMPRYQSHKKVWALKIKSIMKTNTCENCEWDGTYTITPENDEYSPFKVDNVYYRKHEPKVGGYYVVYEDGYKSFSPADAFESGYTLI